MVVFPTKEELDRVSSPTATYVRDHSISLLESTAPKSTSPRIDIVGMGGAMSPSPLLSSTKLCVACSLHLALLAVLTLY
jgi:hypothetical protein